MSTEAFINETAENALQERMASVEGTRRTGRPRAKVACRDCRRRKVRCDVYQRGAPCTNCRLDKIECAVLKRKRHRRPHEQTITLESPGSKGCPSGASAGSPEHAVERSQSASQTYSREACSFEHQQPPISILDEGILDDDLGGLQARNTSEVCADGRHAFPSTPGTLPVKDLPSYIHCDLSHISREDLSYLQGKGCFTLPKKEILDDLLKCYFDYIHPHVPFLDEQEFWETYLDRDSESQRFHHTDGYHISLFLFQAVLFAATTCAPLSVLRKNGYNSRGPARQDAFYKVRALYTLDAERDNMAVLQALLLMSFWRGTPHDDKDAWHWSGLAISVASTLSLHCQSDTQLSERQRTLRKRCWWSCVLRDRLLALSGQRAPRLHLDEYDVPLLTLADYNVGLRCAISELSPEEELGKRTALSMFSLQLIRLVLLVGKEDGPRCGDLDNPSPPARETWARIRLPTHNDGCMTGLADIDFWRLNLPEVLQRPADPTGDDAVLSCILVHRNALQIYYHKLIVSICMPRLLHAESSGDLEHNSRLAHRSRNILAELYDELIDRDSIHCLPGECFGPSNTANHVKPYTALGLESTEDYATHAGRACTSLTSLISGGRAIYSEGTEPAISSLPAPELRTGCGPQQAHGMSSMNTMDIDECHRSPNIHQGGGGDENGSDTVLHFLSDTFWTTGDTESYEDVSSGFPDLSAGVPSTSTPDTNVLTPSTIPNADFLLSTDSGEFAKD